MDSEKKYKEPQKKFRSNDQYFTIAVYAVVVILIGAIIISCVTSFDRTMGVIRKIVQVLMPFIIGGLIAFILNPLVRNICRFLDKVCKIKSSGVRKALSIGLTYVIVIAFIAFTLFGIVPQLVTSITELVNYIPEGVNELFRVFDNLEKHFPNLDMEILRNEINNAIPDMISSIRDFATNMVPALYSLSMLIVKWFFNLLVSIIVSIYMLADKRILRRSAKALIYGFVPVKHINLTMEVLREANKILSNFVIGKAIDSLIIGLLCFFCMSIFKLPYAMLISVIVGITNMIPYFGPFIGAVPGALILLLISPLSALIFIILIIVLQQFDGLYLGPKILGGSVGIKPLWIIVAITIGGSLFGIMGMFLGVPAVAFLQYLLNRILHYQFQKRGITNMENIQP